MRLTCISALVAATFSAASCMDMSIPLENEGDAVIPAVTGKVCDSDGNPIEHIMVTLDWGTGIENNVLYTSSEGVFQTPIPEVIINKESSLTLTLEDVDGEENGGEFESLTDKIMLYPENEEPETEKVTLDYRLNRATPSENNPQS